jgi:hypothetical protein
MLLLLLLHCVYICFQGRHAAARASPTLLPRAWWGARPVIMLQVKVTNLVSLSAHEVYQTQEGGMRATWTCALLLCTLQVTQPSVASRQRTCQ